MSERASERGLDQPPGLGREEDWNKLKTSSAGSHANWSSLVNNAAEDDSKHNTCTETFHSFLHGRAQFHRPGSGRVWGPTGEGTVARRRQKWAKGEVRS